MDPYKDLHGSVQEIDTYTERVQAPEVVLTGYKLIPLSWILESIYTIQDE